MKRSLQYYQVAAPLYLYFDADWGTLMVDIWEEMETMTGNLLNSYARSVTDAINLACPESLFPEGVPSDIL